LPNFTIKVVKFAIFVKMLSKPLTKVFFIVNMNLQLEDSNFVFVQKIRKI